jgi:2-amino-4-hydroxy-6-hydroxymethyldihydropteridine diphosphokinase
MTDADALAEAYVGLGSNLDHPVQHVRGAFDDLARLPGTRVVSRSGLYRSAPLGKPDQPDFINAVARLQTALGACELLGELLRIEGLHGRSRGEPNAARTLDLDLLLYAGRIIDAPGLRVPHPRMHQRAFVLVPLAELDAQLLIPAAGPLQALLPKVAGQQVTRI